MHPMAKSRKSTYIYMNITTILRIDWPRIYSVSHKKNNNANECEMLILFSNSMSVRVLLAFGWEICANNERTRRLANRFKCRKFFRLLNGAPIFSLVNRSAWSMVHPLYARDIWMNAITVVAVSRMHPWQAEEDLETLFGLFFPPIFISLLVYGDVFRARQIIWLFALFSILHFLFQFGFINCMGFLL